MEGIQVSTEVAGSRNHISIIKVGGYIDTTTASELERALDSLLKQGRFNIIVDLGNVDYISSAGWGIFISEIKSIRENGGDLKLVRMVPDVYEIFELLEFHHILDVYDSVDEAINKFEMAESGASVAPAGKPQSAQPVKEVADTAPAPQASVASQPKAPEEPIQEERTIDPANLSLEDKIKEIIKEDPSLGAYRIKKRLNTEKYGFTKVGWFKVRSILAAMDLNSKSKRYQFAMSSN
ncbi:STAS domain-containing protein [Caldithrix abyssi]|uniref:Anti-sigma factor antagonist n=1 Tax=Caldithrix abyssi DSM 13497 TaxID=880073 RepID=H1XSU3_CALAY|nr:STAS domain-containing protein [Caldithrix abyssi]APF20269.1 anti-anti-sigma factor [Caldithrix abyssi DSM 13497]EHO40320.1 anti-sigma-factor antagonist [Caldithrix abyssi DSM 13497]